jgi:hypothetical protein
MVESLRVWLGVRSCLDDTFRKEHPMKVVLWSMAVALFGLAAANFIVHRFHVPDPLHTARISSMDTVQGSLLDRP